MCRDMQITLDKGKNRKVNMEDLITVDEVNRVNKNN